MRHCQLLKPMCASHCIIARSTDLIQAFNKQPLLDRPLSMLTESTSEKKQYSSDTHEHFIKPQAAPNRTSTHHS